MTETCTGLPYGDSLTCAGTDLSPLHHTGKHRDTESGLDNFDARYYASTAGRFLTPDWTAHPGAVPYAVLNDPQTLNLYAFEANNPTSHVDVDGHCPICIVGVGALVGGAIGAAAEVIGDKIAGRPITTRNVVGAFVKGAVVGAAVSSFGLLAPAAGALATAGVAGGANAVGGIADRTIRGNTVKQVLNPVEVAKDTVSGVVGGAAGAKVEKAGEFIAVNATNVAQASGDEVSAAFFSGNVTAISKGAGKAFDLVEGAAEAYHDDKSETGATEKQSPATAGKCDDGANTACRTNASPRDNCSLGPTGGCD